jgi:hypothetical protein
LAFSEKKPGALGPDSFEFIFREEMASDAV